MATNIEANKIALVVIPARSKFWVLWCLDYAVRLRLEGFQVDLLDLSGYSPHWYRKHIRKLLMTLKFNNRLETISKKVCTQYQIRYIKPPRHLNKFFPEIDKSLWTESSRETHVSSDGLKFSFVSLQKNTN